MDPHAELNNLLSSSGVSKIVYALVMPETELAIDCVFGGAPPDTARDHYHSMFREAWTQKQDSVHEAFFEKWVDWTRSIVDLDVRSFPFHYPSAGASEGLREAIHAYGARSRQENFAPKIHLFEGEYEGFAAYARAAGIPCSVHRRSQWSAALDSIGPNDQFYVSQPSAIDGSVWEDFDSFVSELYRYSPTAQLMLDLSYVGCVGRAFRVRADSPNIQAVFFSLSKPAGVYYHRIGGMFSRSEYLGLFGNKWFKNISSLQIGTEFMNRHDVHALPRKYSAIQQSTIEETNRELGLSLKPADIFLLGVGQPSMQPTNLEQYLLRGPQGEELVRVCLTARMAHKIDPKLNPQVAARYYEQFARK